MSGPNSSETGAAARADALALTVHSLPQPAPLDQERTRRGRLQMLLVLLVCAAPVIASYLAFYVFRPEGGASYGALIVPPREFPPAAELPLADLTGQPVDAASLRGQWLLVAVATGGCDTRCEGVLLLQRQLREALGRDKARVDKVWFVTDGAPPRPELLRSLADVTVLRVSRTGLAGWLAPAAGQGLEDHLYLVDPMGQWMLRAPADPDPARLKRDLDRLLRAAASWDRPGR